MDEKLKINLSIANRTYPMRTPASEEFYIREAARLLTEQMEKYRQELDMSDQLDLLVMVAIECLTANLKLEDEYKSLQEAVSQKIGVLNQLLTVH